MNFFFFPNSFFILAVPQLIASTSPCEIRDLPPSSLLFITVLVVVTSFYGSVLCSISTMPSF